MTGKFILEWSESQGCFHIDNPAISFSRNILMYLDAKPYNNWVALGIFNTHEEARKYKEILQTRREEVLA